MSAEIKGERLPEATPTDGRTARSRRTRLAIIDAMRAVHAQGNLRPTALQVAEQAKVSLRTVWQHFDDLESLLAEAGRRDLEILLTMLEPIAADQPLASRITQFAAQRARILEAMTPSWRAARIQEPFSEQLRLNKQRTLGLARADLEAVFGAELDALPETERRLLLDALEAASTWTYWESLRADLRFDPQRARGVLEYSIVGLLAGSGFG